MCALSADDRHSRVISVQEKGTTAIAKVDGRRLPILADVGNEPCRPWMERGPLLVGDAGDGDGNDGNGEGDGDGDEENDDGGDGGGWEKTPNPVGRRVSTMGRRKLPSQPG